MNSQVTGRYQSARGLNLKWTLQFATLLAICTWLLYQISHPYDDKSSPSKSSGRKVNMGPIDKAKNGKYDQTDFEMQRIDSHGDGVTSLIMEIHDKISAGEGYESLLRSFVDCSSENLRKKPEIYVKTYGEALKKTGLELEEDGAVFIDRTENPWENGYENGVQGSGFDDETGVPIGLNYFMESKGSE